MCNMIDINLPLFAIACLANFTKLSQTDALGAKPILPNRAYMKCFPSMSRKEPCTCDFPPVPINSGIFHWR